MNRHFPVKIYLIKLDRLPEKDYEFKKTIKDKLTYEPSSELYRYTTEPDKTPEAAVEEISRRVDVDY